MAAHVFWNVYFTTMLQLLYVALVITKKKWFLKWRVIEYWGQKTWQVVAGRSRGGAADTSFCQSGWQKKEKPRKIGTYYSPEKRIVVEGLVPMAIAPGAVVYRPSPGFETVRTRGRPRSELNTLPWKEGISDAVIYATSDLTSLQPFFCHFMLSLDIHSKYIKIFAFPTPDLAFLLCGRGMSLKCIWKIN